MCVFFVVVVVRPLSRPTLEVDRLCVLTSRENFTKEKHVPFFDAIGYDSDCAAKSFIRSFVLV